MKRDRRRLNAIRSEMGPEANAAAWLEMFRNNRLPKPDFWDFEGAERTADIVNAMLGAHIVLALWIANLGSLVGWFESDLERLRMLSLWLADVESIIDEVSGEEGGSSAPPEAGRLVARKEHLRSDWAATARGLKKHWGEVWEMVRMAELVALRLSNEGWLGEDILMLEERVALTECRRRLEAFADDLRRNNLRVPRVEPDSRSVELLLSWIRR